MTQETLPLGVFVAPEVSAFDSIQDRFDAFHEANPWVLSALEHLAEDMLRRGHRRIGIKMLWEVLRWQYARQTVDPSSPFKASNDYHSRYARLLVERHPEWVDVFELRGLRAA